MHACKSDAAKVNETLENAMQFEKTRNEPVALDNGKLAIQNSDYSGEIKKVPSQEELIQKFKIKTVNETYVIGWCITTYDQNGNAITKELDPSGKKTYSYQLDQNGRVIEEKTQFDDRSKSVKKITYDDKSQQISKSFTNEGYGVDEVTRYEYDDVLGTRKESSTTGTDKEFYDNRGLRVRFESYDERGKLVGFGDAKYGEDGLKISETASLTGLKTKSVNVNDMRKDATNYEYTYF